MHVPQTEVFLFHDGAELARATLPPGEYVIGRSREADVVAETPLLSRRHARLTINYDHLLLEDLGSSNGTFINDQPVAEATRLFPNQRIRLGDVTLEVRRHRAPTEPGVSLAPAQAAIRRLLPDELLAERRYGIGNIVARGGMGAILEARQEAIQRRVAMKVMIENSDPADVLRFIEEAQITGQLEHPNIVPVHELGVDEQDQLFYTMKMVRGITLRKVLELLAAGVPETVKKYSLPALLTIFQKICDALAFAHSKGIIHRDLKLENIMLDDFGVVQVMDWGLAKVVAQKRDEAGEQKAKALARSAVISARAGEDAASMTMAGAIMGTPAYMSPEQARGEVETLDARSDLYALGAILFEMLHLRQAVTGHSAAEIVEKVARGEVEWGAHAPSRAISGALAGERAQAAGSSPAGSTVGAARPKKPRVLPESLLAVCRRSLAFDRAARYPGVAELQADLTAYQNGFATSAEARTAWKRFRLLIRRHKAASLGIAAVLVVGATFGTHAVVQGRRAGKALIQLQKQAPALRQFAESEAGFRRFDSALQKLDAALALDPTYLPSYWRRAWLFIGANRLPEAAAAIRVAQQKNPAQSELAAILPTIDRLAAMSASDFWPEDSARQVYEHLSKVEANGETAALSEKLRLSAVQKEKLIRKSLDAWLGKDRGKIEISVEGTISLFDLPKSTSSLDPLQRLPLNKLDLGGLPISSLEPLRGMRLRELAIGGTKVVDLTPLRDMPLEKLLISNRRISDLKALRGLPLKWLELGEASVSDLSPLRGMPLERLDLGHTGLVDLAPLRGMPLRFLHGHFCETLDFGPLAGAPLEELSFPKAPAQSLQPLRGMPLRKLVLNESVRDLEPLNSAPIEFLEIGTYGGSEKINLSPCLRLLKLRQLRLASHADPSVLRQHPTLEAIAHGPSGFVPVKQFWVEFDAKQAAPKK